MFSRRKILPISPMPELLASVFFTKRCAQWNFVTLNVVAQAVLIVGSSISCSKPLLPSLMSLLLYFQVVPRDLLDPAGPYRSIVGMVLGFTQTLHHYSLVVLTFRVERKRTLLSDEFEQLLLACSEGCGLFNSRFKACAAFISACALSVPTGTLDVQLGRWCYLDFLWACTVSTVNSSCMHIIP